MTRPVFLITGSMGCIGAWVIRQLLDQDVEIIASDLDTTITRPALLSPADQLDKVNWQQLDVTNGKAVHRLVADHGVTHIIHQRYLFLRP